MLVISITRSGIKLMSSVHRERYNICRASIGAYSNTPILLIEERMAKPSKIIINSCFIVKICF